MTLSEFWAMGGHAFYVWSSFGLVALVMLLNVVQPLWSLRRQRDAIRRQLETRT